MSVAVGSILVLCLERILRPVALFCIQRGIRFQDFTETAKRTFLWAARHELTHSSIPSTALRLSVMTGLQRKEVGRVLADEPSERQDQRTLIMRVLQRWETHPKFKTRNGPRVLGAAGKDSDFARLVRSVSEDINPYAILYELERIRAVERKDDTVLLRRATYEPPAGEVLEAFDFLTSDANDLISAVAQNALDGTRPKNLHATTMYDNVDPSALPEIRQWLLEHGERFHREAREHLARFDRDGSATTGARVALGAFSVVSQAKDVVASESKTKLQKASRRKR